MKFFYSVFFLLIAYATYLMIIIALPHLSFSSGVDFLSTKQHIYHIDSWRWSFYIHIFSAIPVLFFGAFQFSGYLLHNYPRLHKTSGANYILVLLIAAAPSGLIMSFYANGGTIAQIGFVIMSLLWILTTLMAVFHLRNKNYIKHGKWMLRSYALTLAAITLRLYGYLFDALHVELPPRETYILLSYLSWIPNLIVAEILIRWGVIERIIGLRK